MSKEAAKAASGFCYLQAVVTGASGIVQLFTGPRLPAVGKLGAAVGLTWAGLDPTPERLGVAAAVSGGTAALDLVTVVRPSSSARQRLFGLAGAAFNAAMAVLHTEAAQDI